MLRSVRVYLFFRHLDEDRNSQVDETCQVKIHAKGRKD